VKFIAQVQFYAPALFCGSYRPFCEVFCTDSVGLFDCGEWSKCLNVGFIMAYRKRDCKWCVSARILLCYKVYMHACVL
jgi:hypothetical protein